MCFKDESDGVNYVDSINPDSLKTLSECRVEPSVADKKPGWQCQFERQGYFCVDPDSEQGKLVFNRTVTLRDTWAKIQAARKK